MKLLLPQHRQLWGKIRALVNLQKVRAIFCRVHMTEEEVLEVLKCIKEDKSPRPVQVFARVEILASTIVTVGASRLKYGSY